MSMVVFLFVYQAVALRGSTGGHRVHSDAVCGLHSIVHTVVIMVGRKVKVVEKAPVGVVRFCGVVSSAENAEVCTNERLGAWEGKIVHCIV
jgi:hypothetical protein